MNQIVFRQFSTVWAFEPVQTPCPTLLGRKIAEKFRIAENRPISLVSHEHKENIVIHFKKPAYLGTEAQLLGALATTPRGDRTLSERERAARVAIGKSLRAKTVRLVRIKKTRFVMTDLNAELPAGVEHECFATVGTSDDTTGAIVLVPIE